MMKTCSECRHWELVTDADVEMAEVLCEKRHFHHDLMQMEAADLRRTLRLATHCQDYAPVPLEANPPPSPSTKPERAQPDPWNPLAD